MFFLVFFSVLNDSDTYDEHAHIPAGYSYLVLKDCRLNPEHPPLIKTLSALPLLFLNLKFPTESPAWKGYINGEWAVGQMFLYTSGNCADRIIFLARLPIIILALFSGWFLFRTVRSFCGDKAALLTLFFFAVSPTVIAHSHYVTTDIGAAFGFFLGIVMFYKFLKKDNLKSILGAGVCLGIALLLKFSTFLLIPLYIIFALFWVFLNSFKTRDFHLAKEAGKIILKLFLIFSIAFLIVLVVYQYHIWNYPPECQLRDTIGITESIQTSGAVTVVRATICWMADKPVLRCFGQYLLGLLMTNSSAKGGTFTYYWGEVSATGWKSYFPMAYLLKEQLAFHILTLFVLIVSLGSFLKKHGRTHVSFIDWLHDNFILTMSFIFIGTYWLISILSSLNIGVRHILPTFPFIYLLVARSLIRHFQFVKSIPKYLFVGILLFWLLVEIIISFPCYLSYHNILAGGTAWGWRYFIDSNYDWGQDLKRLKKFVEKNKIERIKLDYFGKGLPSYYLGERFEPWKSSNGITDGWFAISATCRQHAWGMPVKGSKIKSEDSYSWLRPYEPVARVGQSMFIYYIK